MATSRKRVAKKSTSSRTAQLEEKLEDLVTILRASQPSNGHLHSAGPGDSSPLMNSSSNMGHLTSRLESLATAAASSSSSSESYPRPYTVPHNHDSRSTANTQPNTSPSSIGEDPSTSFDPTPEEAELNLAKFQQWLKNFPCMVLPPDISAATLRKEKPFLWLCIMNITSLCVEQQMKMKDQGLICYISWAATTSSPGRPFIITFCQMAVLLAYELGLTKAPIEEQYFTVCFKMGGGRPPSPRVRTQEERRAVVSLWFLTSVMSSFVGKMDPLRWTPHMSDCLEALERDKLWLSDELLVAFVRYQLVADEAQKLLVRDVMGESSSAPTYVFRKSLLAKLQAVRDGLPANMPITPVLQAHSLATEIQINSVGLFMQNIPVKQRIESMYSCLQTIRSWYDVFFGIPPEHVPGTPFAIYIQLSQVQVALYRLTTSEDPAWDKELVRNTADLLILLDQVVEFFARLDSVYKMKTIQGEETAFALGAKMMNNVRISWEPTLSRHLRNTSSIPTNQGAGPPVPTPPPPSTAQASIDMANINMIDFGDTERSKPHPISGDDKKTESRSNTPTLNEPAQDEKPKKSEDGDGDGQLTTEEEETEWISGWKLASMMISLTLAAFLMLLDMSIISTAVPRITSDFHSLPDIGWYASAYNLASAALQPLTGKIYMYFNTRWTFLALFFVFEVGSLICGVAQSSAMLIIGRAVAGIGSSGIQNGALTMIAKAVPIHRRPSLVGVIMGFAQLGLISGPLIGGAFTQYTTWRWCFYINLPIGAICAVLILFVHMPDHRASRDESTMQILKTKLDFAGFVLFCPSIVMLLLALQWGGLEYPWDSATVIGLFCGGGVLFIIFIYWEHRVGSEAMIPLPIVRTREVWASCLSQSFLFSTVMVASYYFPVYFQSAKNASPFTSGVNLLPSILSVIFAAVASGALAQRVGYYLPFATTSGVLSSIGFGLASSMGPYASTATWAGYQILIGLGRGLGLQMPIIAIQANTNADVTPIAMAILTFSQTFGSAIFITAANVIFTHELRNELVARLPDINADMIIDAGAGAVSEVVSGARLPLVLWSYSKGVRATFLLAVGTSCAMVLSSFGMGWKDIRKKPDPSPVPVLD
ncbi:major facilitator superfamily transporter [Fusarium circinatum]|uniref:Major facilitator superfamily transporter n=1 Tax=Fusarium circinatum TaxID=48490 RepID=A0A8H5T765_FUSCI|nr:major facilitator superfamily transporter [Fusarium circinatum]